MNQTNNVNLEMHKLPYQLSLYSALIAGWASIPLVFSRPIAERFNDMCVAGGPPPDDVGLDTWLEVGSWTWSWMEPPLGTISFFLLWYDLVGPCAPMRIPSLAYSPRMRSRRCARVRRSMQFVREQRRFLGQKMLHERIIREMGDKLVAAYPQYTPHIVRAYAEATALVDDAKPLADDQRLIESLLAESDRAKAKQ